MTEEDDKSAEATGSSGEADRKRNHDASYRQLFEHGELLRELVGHYIGPTYAALVEALDFGQAKPLQATFMTEALQRLESDLVCEVPFKVPQGAHTALHICILLEFQSKVDGLMAARVMEYVGALLKRLGRAKPERVSSGELPFILPIVLYNGKTKWGAALSVEELFGVKADSPLYGERPTLSYKLVDISQMAPEVLKLQRTVLSHLFRMELHDEPQELKDAVHDLGVFLKQHDLEQLQDTIIRWLAELLKPRRILIEPEHINSLEQMEHVMETGYPEWEARIARKAEQEGIEKGIEKGREEGREEGMLLARRETLKRLVMLKFGAQPELAARIDTLELDALELATERILFVTSPAELLESQG